VNHERLLVFLVSFALAGCAPDRTVTPVNRGEGLRAELLPVPFSALVADAIPLGEPAPGSWRDVHPERGQSLAEYKAEIAVRPKPFSRLVLVTTLGGTNAAQRRVIGRTRHLLAAFYGLEVRQAPPIEDGAILAEHRRASRGFGPQVESRFVLDSILVRRRPADAVALLALSTYDLYPEPRWNFVFGQAAPRRGVGVWSMARFGDPSRSADEEQMVLARTIRTASHEFGHILGLAHCIAWHCLMNGSNSLPELDARPLELCPACLAKVAAGLALEPRARTAALADVLEDVDLVGEAVVVRSRLARMRDAGP
jgi:archaemetzincin